MTQAPNPFTQVASQGYGDFEPTLDEEDQDEHNVVDDEDEEQQPDGPQSPEPEEQGINEYGFTQTQERSYPTGVESSEEDANEDENDESKNQIETSDHEQEHEIDDDDEEAGPSSPADDDADVGVSNDQQEEEEEKEEHDEDENQKQHQSQHRRRVQIMNDSDNEDEQPESTSVVSKEKNRHFLKQFTMQNEDSHKKHKRRNDEHQHHHDKKSKRLRKTSNDEDDHDTEEKNTDHVEGTSDVEDVVDDIFGKDVNDNVEEGDDQEEVTAELADLNADNEDAEEQQTFEGDEDDDEDTSIRKNNYPISKNNINYEIDLILEKKAEKRRGNRRRGGKNGEEDITDPANDQLVANLINQMKIATEEDRIFNKSRQPATAKLLLLPIVEQQLCRAHLNEIFLETGILTVFKDWLSPLPDKSLPNIKIREAIIKILPQLEVKNTDYLRDSGIGKALMYLYKHPRETKENKIKLIRIIHDWARPIFNLNTDYKLLSREHRQQRDTDQASLKRQTSSTGKPKNRSADMDLLFDNDKRQDDDDCPRARVPRPSNKDYVVRPVSTVEYSEKKDDSKKRTISRLDEIKRRQQEQKRQSKPMSVVKLSIEGNKMHL